MSRWPAVFSSIIYDVPPLQSITPPKGTRRTPGRPQAVLQCNSGEQGYRAIRFCMEELCGAWAAARACKGRPTVVIANTVKGCGSTVMENKAPWHHKVPGEEEYAQIMKDLKERREALYHE